MKKLFIISVLFICIYNVFAQDINPLGYLNDKVNVAIVDITTAWNPTGVNLVAGDTVLVLVNGIAATDGLIHKKTITWVGPEGMGGPDWIAGANLPLPGAATHSVIGKIGSAGTPFYVGRNGSFVTNVSGELFLGLNDDIFWDNYGYYVAFISIAKHFSLVNVNEEFNSGKIDFSISQNYPNPFNPTTTINYSVPGASNVKITVYDINGQTVKHLINEFKSSGNYSVYWDGLDDSGSKVSSGAYFYQLQIGNLVQTKKMILLK